MKNHIIKILFFPRRIFYNFICFPFKVAVKLPLDISPNVKIKGLKKNSFSIAEKKISKSMIKIGYGGAPFVSTNKSLILIDNGNIIFHNNVVIASGCNLYIKNGTVVLEDNLYANKNLTIQCENKIFLGKNTLIGWDVNIRDTDGHPIIINNEKKIINGEISILEHVWIASNVTILKNTLVRKNSVIACNSLLTNYKSENDGELIAGIPAMMKKKNINWEK